MKARFMFLILALFSQVSSTSMFPAPTYLDLSEIIHENAELGKVAETKDGSNVIISKRTDKDNPGKTLISKLDKNGNFLYHREEINLEYSMNAQIVQSKIHTGEEGYTLYYKSNGKEVLALLKDKGEGLNTESQSNSYNTIVSALTLKNEKVFLAGVTKPSSDYVQTNLEITVFDPQAKTIYPSGISLKAYDHHVSCAELKDNEVYCVYVQDENHLRSLLKIQHFKINDIGTVIPSEPILIKAFFTQFNYVKVTKLSQNKIAILFQTGNKKLDIIPFGNTGKDLFYYELEVTPTTFGIIRYDYIFNNCRYKDQEEDYTIDLISPYEDIVYAICEVDNGGKDAVNFELIKISGPEKKFELIVLNKFGAKAIKNPSFVRMENSLGILYTRIDNNDKKDVMLLMMNYPDCEELSNDLKVFSDCTDKNKINSLFGLFRIFIRNPYPQSMSTTPLYFRLINTNGMKIYNGENEIELNKDYSTSIINSLTLKDYTDFTGSFIEYTVSRKDSDEVILGRTCKIKIGFPKCQDACKGCDEGSTKDDNKCFDCKDGFYPVETKIDTTGCGKDGKLYNCNPCDIACTQCTGPFDPKKPTTSCKPKKCNYTLDYYPYDKDDTICIHKQNKTFWDEQLKCFLYFDKTKGENKEDWFWSCCHRKCGSCHMAGTDEHNNCDTCKKDEFFFYCNQTEENEGIPGNCHDTCENNGCFKKKVGIHEKMCDCLPHCKVCKNNETCEECREEWLLPPEKTSCDKSCAHCLTPHWTDEQKKTNGTCLNCKTNFDPPRYTYNGKCYLESEIPEFTYKEYRSENDFYEVVKKYHVYEEKCNLLTACKKGCFTCAKEKSENCTQCEEDYYMEDPFNITRKSFYCFTKRQCRGNDSYPHNPELLVGGVPIEEEGKLVCLNCRQRNDSYRQPEENYYCGPYKNRTFVEIPGYNKLTDCYVRCKTCDVRGQSCAMGCTSCRDSAHYDLIRYDKTHGQCYRKQHKCGIYPYYHNYELATDEDNCGEDCDVCLYNFQCPKEFPFFKLETHECVEFCDATNVLGGACNVNTTSAIIILLRNPFGLRYPYDPINKYITWSQIFKSNLVQYFIRAYPELGVDIETINNYVGHGQVFNLPESKFIIGNNISIELTSVRLELEKLINYTKGIKGGDSKGGEEPKVTDEPEETDTTGGDSGGNSGGDPGSGIGGTSALNLSECEKILKKKYDLPEEEELMIIKADYLRDELNLTDFEFFFLETDYQLFSVSLGAFLPLEDCKKAGLTVDVTDPVNKNLLKNFQSKTASVLLNGYDVFDASSPFYNDVCTPYTNENGNDVLLDSRRKDYYDENVNLCGTSCTFVGYNTKSMTYTCRCNFKSIPGEDTGEYQGEIVERTMPENFKNLISKRSNIAVFKCATNVFSAEGQKNNFGSYILLASFSAFIGVLVFHFVKERGKAMDLTFKELGNVANPPKHEEEENKDKKEKKGKNEKTEKKGKNKKITKKDNDKVKAKENYDDFIDKPRPKDIVKDLTYTRYELNFISFKEALSNDTFSYIQTYWNFLQFKQLIIFTFFTKTKGILRSTKITLFILFIAFYMAFTALFFNDSIMRALYIYKGNTNAAIHIPNIILSSVCSFIAGLIVRFVCLNERDISKVASEKHLTERKEMAKKVKKSSNLKLIILYAISGVLILLCWYYVSAFCAIFKNSQKNYLINFVACFIVCNLWPFVTSIIPTVMRRKSLDNKNECLYKASQIVSIF